MRNRGIRIAAAACGLSICLAGCCMVPAYRLPQGFSSTYHRHLYGMDPLVICGVPEDALPANTAPGVFYPTVVGLKGAPADEGAQRAAEQPPRVLLQPAQAAKKAPARPR